MYMEEEDNSQGQQNTVQFALGGFWCKVMKLESYFLDL